MSDFPPLPRWFEVNVHPSPDGIAICFRDRTEEHANQEKLRLLKAAIERSNDIILITEGRADGRQDQPRIVHVNKAFGEQTGFRRHDALSSTPRMLQGPETQQAARTRRIGSSAA